MEKPTILLSEKKNMLVAVAANVFDYFVSLPKSVRLDEKERTGIQVLVREPGTQNRIFFSVGQPPEGSVINAVEKAVRSDVLGNLTSQDSENPDKMQYRGSVTFVGEHITIQASVSGLLPDEDVAIAVAILTLLFDYRSIFFCRLIEKRGGAMPINFEKEGHYLQEYIFNS
jgi:hypothetical protein